MTDIQNDIVNRVHNESDSGKEVVHQLIENSDYINDTDVVGYWDTLFKLLARDRISDDLSETDLENLASMLSEASFCSLAKTSIIRKVDELVQENQSSSKNKPSGGQIEPINFWLEKHIDRVVKIESSDRVTETKFRFEFDGHDKTIETTREHRAFNEMKRLVRNLADVRVGVPDFSSSALYENGDWTDYIEDFGLENQEKEYYIGARTACLDSIFARISTVFASLEEAVNNDGVYYDDDNEELYIHSTLVNRQCEAHGVSPEKVQSELSSRGVIDGKASHQISVNGNPLRFWVIPKTFVTDERDSDLTLVSMDDTDNFGQDRTQESL